TIGGISQPIYRGNACCPWPSWSRLPPPQTSPRPLSLLREERGGHGRRRFLCAPSLSPIGARERGLGGEVCGGGEFRGRRSCHKMISVNAAALNKWLDIPETVCTSFYGTERAKRAIAELGIGYHLVTRFTSFVAVDRQKTVGDGHPVHVTQPVEVPEGAR